MTMAETPTADENNLLFSDVIGSHEGVAAFIPGRTRVHLWD